MQNYRKFELFISFNHRVFTLHQFVKGCVIEHIFFRQIHNNSEIRKRRKKKGKFKKLDIKVKKFIFTPH